LKKIGLTGGIGSGKSWVRKLLLQLNYPCFDADQFTKSILDDPIEAARLALTFGEEIFTSSNTVDRTLLRDKVFQDSLLKEKLEQFMHPKIQERWAAQAKQFQNCAVGDWNVWLFYEAALLFEANRKSDFDCIVLVTAPEEIRLKRLETHRGLSKDAALSVMKNQWNDEKKLGLADFVIVNDSGLDELKAKTFEMLLWLSSNFAASKN
jgi:dephospho-CoA kinase